MPILENVREERFASAIAKGMTNEQAYKFAGYKGLKVKDSSAHVRAKVHVKARIKELTARIENNAVTQASAKLALDKELVLRKLMENAERAEKVKGGSNVVTRCWELIGKHIGMWKDDAGKPLTAEDLTIEQLEEILKGVPKPVVQ